MNSLELQQELIKTLDRLGRPNPAVGNRIFLLERAGRCLEWLGEKDQAKTYFGQAALLAGNYLGELRQVLTRKEISAELYQFQVFNLSWLYFKAGLQAELVQTMEEFAGLIKSEEFISPVSLLRHALLVFLTGNLDFAKELFNNYELGEMDPGTKSEFPLQVLALRALLFNDREALEIVGEFLERNNSRPWQHPFTWDLYHLAQPLF